MLRQYLSTYKTSRTIKLFPLLNSLWAARIVKNWNMPVMLNILVEFGLKKNTDKVNTRTEWRLNTSIYILHMVLL